MIKEVLRPSAYVIAPTNHGTMIVNRFDYRQTEKGAYGVGHQLLNTQSFDQDEVNIVLQLLTLRREIVGDGVIGLDVGANIGVHTIEWARHMHGWGEVLSIEAQQRIYYALAGNIAINNCFNAEAIWAAVSDKDGSLDIPEPNYFMPSSFGSFELKKRKNNEFIGQEINWNKNNLKPVTTITIDSLNLQRLDLIKIDIEGMEEAALKGAGKTISQKKPIIVIEKIKSDRQNLLNALTPYGYRSFEFGLNFLMIHKDDKSLEKISGLKEVMA